MVSKGLGLELVGRKLIMQEIGRGSSLQVAESNSQSVEYLEALSHDRLRVMAEIGAKGWVMWWFRRLRRSAR